MSKEILLKNVISFVDTHAHLTDRAFDEDRDMVIKNCYDMGVERVITSGFNIPSSREAVALAQKYQGVYASVGVYPENILELDENAFKSLSKLAQENKVVAIGEIGLQWTENMPSKERQIEGFIAQLSLANSLKLPVIIHCREASGDMLQLLRENHHLLKYGGTMHCFSGSLEIAKELMKLGLHISVGGVSTFKNATSLHKVIAEIPLERILLETDCPYLTPHPYRGKRNSPCFIPTIAENLAKLKGLELEKVIRQTTKNAKELFKI